MENKEKYKKLKILDSDCTEFNHTKFYLLNPEEKLTENNKFDVEVLDSEYLYDIKIIKNKKKSKEYFNKKIYETVKTYGKVWEPTYRNEITAFFKEGNLECRLKSGFLMRVHDRATSERNAKKLMKEAKRLNELTFYRKMYPSYTTHIPRGNF